VPGAGTGAATGASDALWLVAVVDVHPALAIRPAKPRMQKQFVLVGKAHLLLKLSARFARPEPCLQDDAGLINQPLAFVKKSFPR
jgi:hypothetical protein